MYFRYTEPQVTGRWAVVELLKNILPGYGWLFNHEDIHCTICGHDENCGHEDADHWYVAFRRPGQKETGLEASYLESVSVLLKKKDGKWWAAVGQWCEFLPCTEDGPTRLMGKCRFYYHARSGQIKGVWAGDDVFEGPFGKSFEPTPEEEYRAEQRKKEQEKAEELAKHPELTWEIEKLDLRTAACNSIRRWLGIETVAELVQRSPKEILQIRGIGCKTLKEIVAKLDAMGLHLWEK